MRDELFTWTCVSLHAVRLLCQWEMRDEPFTQTHVSHPDAAVRSLWDVRTQKSSSNVLVLFVSLFLMLHT
jgi:hypothetical protein